MGGRGSVLDLGCGSGEPVARYVIELGHNVTGVDASDSLVRLCRQRFAQQRWLTADRRNLQLGEKFAGILAWNSFFHLSQADQRCMFAVVQGSFPIEINVDVHQRSRIERSHWQFSGRAALPFESEPLGIRDAVADSWF
ncbi:class I SAM-dependent methyltransferase [Pseudomonas fluorescens]|uniref:class I SAM-dependent methyltransferase n=1 Tax=Pseudomonas fluorescens TaxID=294 RepID=UPI0021E51B05|nr:class I SAM-dependent methyltransferase [Pseudomonas fluorescens]